MDKIDQIWPAWHTVELIGRGGFGEVYKVKREQLGEVFYSAVKVIQIPKEESEIKEMLAEGHTSQSVRYYYESIAKGLMNEIKVMDTLKSAGNVVNIEAFEICERTDSIGWDAFIRMELLQNLNEYRRSRMMDQTEVAKLGTDICEALVCCEQSHIIHRDIKPSNIFVDKYGNFKLGDFGIARQMEKTQGTLSIKGTDFYMAPEVRFGESGSSYNVDIYSLGLVMYQLLNRNRMPFEPVGKELMGYQERDEALGRRLRGERLSLPIDCDTRLGKIILKACEADKKKRYQHADQMKAELEAWIQGKNENIQKVKTEPVVVKKESEKTDALENEIKFEDEKTMSAFTSTEFEGKKKQKVKEKVTGSVCVPKDEKDIRIDKKTDGNIWSDEKKETKTEEKYSALSKKYKKYNRARIGLFLYTIIGFLGADRISDGFGIFFLVTMGIGYLLVYMGSILGTFFCAAGGLLSSLIIEFIMPEQLFLSNPNLTTSLVLILPLVSAALCCKWSINVANIRMEDKGVSKKNG